MPTISRRTALGLGAAAVSAPLLGSCSGGGSDSQTQDKIDDPDPNINPTGMPIVDEPITLTMMTGHKPATADDWDSVASVRRMEELSNVHVEWGPVPSAGIAEKRNLALASGDYPEVLNRTSLTSVDLTTYGEQGTFIPLNGLIDDYMPNLKAVMDEYPDIASGMTMPDGNIYSMPTIYDPEFDALIMQRKLWVRQDWLDDFGMAEPTTLEEFEAYLTEVKGRNPVPAGAPDAIPFTASSNGSPMYEMFWGTFGIATRGRTAHPLDADPSGTLRFVPTSDGWREELEFMSRLYAQGLVQTDVFTNDAQTLNGNGRQGIIGACVHYTPIAAFGEDIGSRYVALPPLKKSSADPVPSWNSVMASLVSLGQFVITDHATHPIEAARWMDHYFGDDGARLFFLGIEGESYERTADGSYEFTDMIADNPDGLTANEALKPYVTYMGGTYAGIVMEAYFKGAENSPQSREGTAKVSGHRIDEVWPAFTYTSEEAAELSSLTVDVEKLTDESRDGFVNGKRSLSEWDDYVGQFDSMGIARYLEIQQAAHDRYQG